jgi:probable F420-dependent oxidoreductase
MGAEHDALRGVLGRVGVWTFAFDARPARQIGEDARAIEGLGFLSLWVPEGGGSRDVIGHLSWLLGETKRLAIASGIANITARQPEVLQAGATSLADAYGERMVLGVGVGHQYSTGRRGVEWAHPLERMRAYLDRMDEVADTWPPPDVPARRLLAALGDGMLRLSAERALGAHTYFVPPEHTAHARKVLGQEPVLAVEQTVVLDDDPSGARAVAAPWAAGYLELPNYVNNWRRFGYGEDDVTGDPSDRLVDAAIAWGSVDDVARRVREHLDAGADHVCVQVISADEADACLPQLRVLAPALLTL